MFDGSVFNGVNLFGFWVLICLVMDLFLIDLLYQHDSSNLAYFFFLSGHILAHPSPIKIRFHEGMLEVIAMNTLKFHQLS